MTVRVKIEAGGATEVVTEVATAAVIGAATAEAIGVATAADVAVLANAALGPQLESILTGRGGLMRRAWTGWWLAGGLLAAGLLVAGCGGDDSGKAASGNAGTAAGGGASAAGQEGVILLRYTPGSESTFQREEGFLEELQSHPHVGVLSSDQYSGTTPEESLVKAQQVLQKFGPARKGFSPFANRMPTVRWVRWTNWACRER